MQTCSYPFVLLYHAISLFQRISYFCIFFQKSWLNLRCLTLNAIVYATSLVMSIVKVEHYMISESQHEIAENVPPESVKSLNSLLSTMNDLDSQTKEPSTRELSNFKLLVRFVS